MSMTSGRRWFIGSLLVLGVFSSSLSAQFFVQGKVVKVTDGDSVTIFSGQKKFKIRLHGIDAPEKAQAYSQKSRQALSKMLLNQPVRLIVRDVDRYGRLVAEIYVNELNINLEMLLQGWAWHYTQYDDSQNYAKAQTLARLQKKGLWADSNPTPPWIFRKM